MTYKIVFTKVAEKEFETIYRYYRETFLGAQPALEVTQGIRDAIDMVRFEPEEALSLDARIGAALDGNHKIYFTISEQYLIFFVVMDETIAIVHLLRARTDVMNHLKCLFEKERVLAR
ncbi:MAG: type II toxin-antitoxin system RelE/ParE family toxin [Streptococcaceae bacterium]|jgi:plasmid stabilization system protein ParE|nr:type II toxin-antitoxin system RelE/ParE family toxin [Streptococcaceae bacterium]